MAVIRIHDSYSDTNIHWVALDHLNLPRYWSTIWSFYRSSELADSSLLKQLGYLDGFYCFSDDIEYPGVLDDAIANIDIKVLGQLLEAYFIHLQNKQPINDATCKKWETAFRFLKDSLFWISKNAQSYQSFFETEAKIRSLETLYGQLRIGTRKTQETIRSIPINLIEHLVEVLDPAHPKNPFRNDSAKWRVYVVFNLLLYLGLRSGELLNLNASPIRNEFDKRRNQEVYWIRIAKHQDADTDRRHSSPGIKTVDSVRQIPIFEWLANMVEEYASNHRGKPNHSYLLNSQKNNPLSYEAVKLIFWNISRILPASLVKELEFKTGNPLPSQSRKTLAGTAQRACQPSFGW